MEEERIQQLLYRHFAELPERSQLVVLNATARQISQSIDYLEEADLPDMRTLSGLQKTVAGTVGESLRELRLLCILTRIYFRVDSHGALQPNALFHHWQWFRSPWPPLLEKHRRRLLKRAYSKLGEELVSSSQRARSSSA